MSQTNERDMTAIWSSLQEKFCVQLKEDFSSQDPLRWLNHFAANHKIDVHQNGKDVTGKSGDGKTVKVYTGGWLASLFKGRIPAIMMAKILFKRLAKQQYSHSDIDLLGIQVNGALAKALVAFKRYNQSGEEYEAAVGLYTLAQYNDTWLITEISTFDSLEQISSSVTERFWKPEPTQSSD